MTDEEMELTCFSLITAAGAAKSLYMQAAQEASNGNFDAAEKCIKDADEALIKGHAPHTEMIQKEAAGEHTPISILLVHAEDQMVSTETFKVMAQQAIALYRRIHALEAKLGEDGSPC
ncbi:MAG: PTS lactose/cellobiose transporter subunit IIA [Coriobacteriaceae bacterium]|nr:MAG: PTS lactose/cellobiose transporter subunit IIA [Coriobacteriaceae bacterium]